jgi:hypothetical protein
MSEMNSRRAGSGAATAERPARRVPSRPTTRAAARTQGFSRASGAYSQNRLRFVTGIALVIAVVAGVIGYEGFAQASRSQKRLAALQGELSAFQRRLSADEAGVASERLHVRSVAAKAIGVQKSLNHVNWELASVPTEAEVARVRGALDSYAACMPQLRRELEGLGINWRIDPVKPASDYFKLVTVAPMSASCATLLAGR